MSLDLRLPLLLRQLRLPTVAANYRKFAQEAAQQRGQSASHAYRCLANRWLAIAWTLWQRRQPYDEAYHLQQRAARCRPRS